MREPRRHRGTPAALVQRLSDRHHKALAYSLKLVKVRHWRGTSPLVTVPFLLAGYYLAKMLTALAQNRDHRPTRAFLNPAFRGVDDLDEKWGSVAFARELFLRPKDQEAWLLNCSAAAGWLEILKHTRHDSLSLVRGCDNYPKCRAPFYLYAGGPLNARFCRRCGNRGRVAASRARRHQARVTGLRVKQKVSA